MLRSRRVVAIALVALVAAGCDTGDGRDMHPPTMGQRINLAAATTTTTTTPTFIEGTSPPTTPTSEPPDAFSLEVPWEPGGAIDARFTCTGESLLPAMTWTTPPPGTAELVLLVRDKSANNAVHWVVAGIEPTAGQQQEGVAFSSGVEGVNGFDEVGWTAPCPSPTDGPHTYLVQLVALSERTDLPERFSVEDLFALPSPNPIVVADAAGTFPAEQLVDG